MEKTYSAFNRVDFFCSHSKRKEIYVFIHSRWARKGLKFYFSNIVDSIREIIELFKL
jgi:hypothetical protein